MAADESRDNFTPDGKHLAFGSDTTVPMPPNFTAPDSSTFQPGSFGRIIDETGHAIEGGAEEGYERAHGED